MDMKRDICIATDVYNKLGGIERYNVELADALSKAGHRVTLLASKVDYRTDNLVRAVTMRTYIGIPALRFFWISVKTSFAYHRFKKEHPDGIFISSGLPSFFCDMAIAQSVHRQAVIVTNAREPKTAKGYLRRFLRKVRPLNLAIILFEWFVVKFGAKRIIAIAEKVKREIVALYKVSGEKVVVVHSGVNAVEFAPNPETRKSVRAGAGFSEDDFLFLFSGNEFKRKGLLYLIQALALINEPKAKLVVAGRAKDEAFKKIAEESGVADRVFFIGPRSDFADWCAACDAFVFPTLDEPFGLVIVEALAAGIPVVTSSPKYAGASECLKDGFDSILLPDPKDALRMAEHMQRLMKDRTLRETLGRNGRRTAEGLSWSKTAAGIVAAWGRYREAQ